MYMLTSLCYKYYLSVSVTTEVSGSEEETDIDELHESLKLNTDFTSVLPVCNSSVNNVFRYIISHKFHFYLMKISSFLLPFSASD